MNACTTLLQELLLYIDNRDVTMQFDAIAEMFHHDTGYMRPGKSQPLEMIHTDEERAKAWNLWCMDWRARLIAQLEEALYDA